MKTIHNLFVLLAFGIMTTLGANIVRAEEVQFDKYKNIADNAFMQAHATVPMRDDVVIVDSRPERKYDSGYISPALNIPDRKFEKMTDMLPADKSTLLVFYCGGLKCPLSHKSAFKAEGLGYTNIKVYAAGYPDWVKNGGIGSVSATQVKKMAGKAVVVDSRPARKFEQGHVPGAISIPDRQFDKMTNLLPKAKETPLIFYCGGYKCPLSSKSAAKAMALGYTDVKTYQAGYPDWVKVYGAGETASMKKEAVAEKTAVAQFKIETGDEPDTITFESFKNIVANHADSVYLIDVRDEAEFKTGSFPTAIHMTVDQVETGVAKLPTDKPIIFVCSTGARSGEAYDIVRMAREKMQIYFLDATVTHAKDGTYTLAPAG